ncbi:acyltransferase family protein [Desulfovibrio sp. UCD-KL4C]|uniref:acyltransferase family protein n=1 Tax=Desulfovibrio sp. UCD-KL4C TaxID=2578120 RepID=UPI0025C3D06B|nr:acyltransferase family protein [Desulfovibrio sp. UCD-KL4C]
MNKRLYFLDNLRGITISMVVLLHVFLCYMKYAPSWWYVINPEQSMLFTYGVILIDVPIMPIMFFIAGYFSLSSMQKHGVYDFWAAKFRRIVIPWVLGVFFLAPPSMYMILLSRGKAPDYIGFWFGQFWKSMFSQSVFWFLGLLIVCYLILTGCYNMFENFKSIRRESKKPTVILPILFIAITSAIFLGMNQFFAIDKWVTDYYVIIFQPVRVFLYLLYFGLGVLAWKRRWFETAGFTPKLIPWLILSVLSAITYLPFKLLMASRGTELAIQAGNAIGFNIFAFTTMMACFALFKHLFNSDGPLWKSFSASSYGIYLFHSVVVYYGAYFLLKMDASPFVKAPILFIGSIIICWALTALLKKSRIVSRII